jgi:peptidoglycan/LPS O-acetylase OafA/YrhL
LSQGDNRPLSALHTPELDDVRGLALLMVVLFHVFLIAGLLLDNLEASNHYRGTITFGLHIVRQGLNHLLHDLYFGAIPGVSTPATPLVTTVSVATPLLLAIASWRWFERPLTDRGRRTFHYSEAMATQ